MKIINILIRTSSNFHACKLVLCVTSLHFTVTHAVNFLPPELQLNLSTRLSFVRLSKKKEPDSVAYSIIIITTVARVVFCPLSVAAISRRREGGGEGKEERVLAWLGYLQCLLKVVLTW